MDNSVMNNQNNRSDDIVTIDNNMSNSETDLRDSSYPIERRDFRKRAVICCRSLGRCLFTWSPPTCLTRLACGLTIPVFVWSLGFLLIGDALMPHGPLFGLFFIEFAGIGLGYVIGLFRLPPLLGMLFIGILMRNNALLDFGNEINPLTSSSLRQLALVIILIRAGLGLDPDSLLRLKNVVLRLAFLPCLSEAITIAIFSHFLLDFPFLWGLLIGFVFAAVSPAVIVPCLLNLQDKGYGQDKGISTIVIAASSIDDILAISLFGVVLGFTLTSTTSTENWADSLAQGPIEFLLGISFGLIYGYLNGIFLSKPDKKGGHNGTLLRVFFTVAGGILSVFGFQYIKYPGAGALGCLTSSFVSSVIWRKRDILHDGDNLTWAFSLLWYIFQPLLFGLIGREIDIDALDNKLIGLGILCTCIGLLIRSLVTFLVVSKAGFNIKEKIFITISWLPKATVQAALGPIALDTVRQLGSGPEAEELSLKILGLAVLVILLTAPLGAILITILGPKLLTRQQPIQNQNQNNSKFHGNSTVNSIRNSENHGGQIPQEQQLVVEESIGIGVNNVIVNQDGL